MICPTRTGAAPWARATRIPSRSELPQFVRCDRVRIIECHAHIIEQQAFERAAGTIGNVNSKLKISCLLPPPRLSPFHQVLLPLGEGTVPVARTDPAPPTKKRSPVGSGRSLIDAAYPIRPRLYEHRIQNNGKYQAESATDLMKFGLRRGDRRHTA